MCKKEGDLVTRIIDFVVISAVHQYFQVFSSWACGRVAASCSHSGRGHVTCFGQVKCKWKYISEKGFKSYGTFIQWNSMQQRERWSLYPLQQHGWNLRALC